MANPIVTVNVSQVQAPTPNNLQKLGAIISQGGTTLSSNTTSLLTKLADLTALLAAPVAVTTLSWATNTATVTAAAHGMTIGDTFVTTITGATPAIYNGTFLATVTTSTAFTYSLPGTALTTPATGTIKYTPRNSAELLLAATTFFAQGSGQGVYVLELGAGEPAAGVTALTNFIAAQPSQPFYAYLVPKGWDAAASFLTFLNNYTANTAKTYFFVTTTSANYSNYTAVMKDVAWMIEAPGVAATEFSIAAWFYDLLNNSPSTTNKVRPFAFDYLFGVTPYPLIGNNTLLTNIQTAGGNVIGTGAEGGISTTLLDWGTTADGRDMSYWYSVDWVQINADLRLSNAVINGSNNPTNPLYLNQNGIDRLQAVLVGLMNSGVSFGLVLGNVTQTSLPQDAFNAAVNAGTYAGQCVVNAIPFSSYYKLNPSDFKIGKYTGFTIVYTPNRGFTQIVVNVVVTDFVAQ